LLIVQNTFLNSEDFYMYLLLALYISFVDYVYMLLPYMFSV